MAAEHEITPGVLVMCKGGTPNPSHRLFAGTVHTVRELACQTDFGNRHGRLWFLDPPTMCRMEGFSYLELTWSADYLTVLRNPGEDAKDEILRPLPVEVTA